MTSTSGVLRAAASRRAHRIAVAVSAAFTSTLALAQTPETVVVTAAREALARERVTGDLVVIDPITLRNARADSLEDLLRREAGLQVSRNGGPGQNASLLVRGANASGVVVLIDGVRVGSATLGQFGFETLALETIERIEVLRGAASSLWGADAMGGVIAITTRQGGSGASKLAAHAAVGTLRSHDVGVSASGQVGAIDLAASLAHEQSQGVSAIREGDAFGLHNPDRDGFARTGGHVKLGFEPAAGHRVGFSLFATKLDAQYDSAEFDPVTFAPDPSPDFRNHQRTQVTALDYRGPLAETWTHSVQLARSEDDLTSGGTTLAPFTTVRDQLTWQHRIRLGAATQVVAAYEHLKEEAGADAFGRALGRRNHAAVLGVSSAIGAHSLQADVRHDRNSVFGSVDTGRVGWRMKLDDAWWLRASAGTAFRAPSFNELYFPGYGVTTLRPERGRSAEVGAGWRGAASDASLTLHRLAMRDLIAYEADPAACPADPSYAFGCARNIQRARTQGATLTASHWVSDALQIGATIDHLDAKDAATGARLPRRAREQASVRADWTRGPWALGASLLHVGARSDGGATLPAFTTLDLGGSWRLAPGWRLETKLLNVADAHVEPARDYQSPGRRVWLGVRHEGRAW